VIATLVGLLTGGRPAAACPRLAQKSSTAAATASATINRRSGVASSSSSCRFMDRARFQQDRWHARSVKQRLRGVRCDLRGCWPVPVSALGVVQRRLTRHPSMQMLDQASNKSCRRSGYLGCDGTYHATLTHNSVPPLSGRVTERNPLDEFRTKSRKSGSPLSFTT
jgi:hypothetical protein